MKKIVFTIVCLLMVFVSNNLNAQVVVRNPFYSSTVQEGILRGRGAYWQGRGNYLRDLGVYEQRHQSAYEHYLDNQNKQIDLYWDTKDQWQARRNASRKTWIQQQEESFELAKKLHELKLTEKQLIEDGILPPKKEPAIIHNGNKYSNYEEFKKSKDWLQMKEDVANRQRELRKEQALAEISHLSAIDFSLFWDKLSHSQKMNYRNMSQTAKNDLFMQFMAKYRNQDNSFYEIRPYLIPQAGKNGLPPYYK